MAGLTYQKNYEFEFDFGPPWGHCAVTMTSVSGHLYTLRFGPEMKNWGESNPIRLFDAPVYNVVEDDVGIF